MDKNKVKTIYLKGYLASVKSLIEELKKQEKKLEVEIERCLKREDE